MKFYRDWLLFISTPLISREEKKKHLDVARIESGWASTTSRSIDWASATSQPCMHYTLASRAPWAILPRKAERVQCFSVIPAGEVDQFWQGDVFQFESVITFKPFPDKDEETPASHLILLGAVFHIFIILSGDWWAQIFLLGMRRDVNDVIDVGDAERQKHFIWNWVHRGLWSKNTTDP